MTVISKYADALALIGLSGCFVAAAGGCASAPTGNNERGSAVVAGNLAGTLANDQTGSTIQGSGTGGLVGYGAPSLVDPSTATVDGGTGGATGDTTSMLDDGTCGGVEVEPMVETVVVPGNVLVVFDESLSMNEIWSSGQTKWNAASQAVIDGLTPIQDQINAATLFFPSAGGFGCDVAAIDSGTQIDFMSGTQFLMAWNTYMGSHGPGGFTPTGTAMQMADAALAGAPLVGNTAVVVITDGDPNCGTNDSQVNTYAANWLANGIQTHVIGLPGASGGQTRLNALAAAGGTGQYLVPTDAAALQSALASIATSAVSTATDYCNITLPEPPPNPDDVTLTVVENGTQQAVAKDLGTGGGWTMDTSTWQITLFGNLCDQATAGTYEKISVVFGCVSLPPLPPPEPPVLK